MPSPHCRQCYVCAKFIPDTAPGPDNGPAFCDEHRPVGTEESPAPVKRWLFRTEREIEIVADTEEEATRLVHAELHDTDDETILSVREAGENE